MKRVLTILFTAVVIVCYSCGPEEKPSAELDSEKILNSSIFKGVTDSLKQNPEDVQLLLRRATLLSQHNLHQVATPDYKKAWELTKNDEVALMYASNLLLSDDIEEAVTLLGKASAEFPDNSEFARRLGEVYMQRGDFAKAMEQYDYILSSDSTNFEAWFDKGTLLSKMKDTAAAIAAFENSFTLLPINYSGLALANLYVAKKDPRALEVCNILLARDSSETQTEPVYMKGVYYSELQEYDKALKEFEECIRRDWKMTDAYIEKGIILFERKQYKEALKVFDLATTVSNTDADAYYWMGRCFESTGDKEKAVLNYQRAFSLDNSFIEARAGIRRLNG